MQEVERSGGRGTYIERNWTQGSIVGNLLLLSWPIVLSSSFNILGPVIDMIWVGKLGAAAIAGVGVAGMAVMTINAARMGLAMGTRAMVARFIGAGDSDGANHVAQQAFVISAIYVIIVASIGIFFAEQIMMIFGLEADVVAEGAAYMRVMFIGTVAMSFRIMSESIMQASGDTVTPMRVTVGFRLLHAFLSPFFIFGLWIFPRLGVAGAATANAISQGAGGAIGLWILFSGRSRLHLTMRNFRFDPPMVWRIVKIGIPAAIMNMERSFGDLVVMWFMAPFGTLAVAGHSLLQRAEAVLRMPCMGLGNASGVLVGQNLGARQPDRAAKSGWLATALGQAFAILVSAAIWLWAEHIIRVFNSEPGVVEVASTFLRIAAVGYLFMGFYFIMQNAIAGAGDTLPPMLIAALNFWLVQVPLAFVLPRVTDLGVLGVRWAIVAGWVVGALAFALYFQIGRWKLKNV